MVARPVVLAGMLAGCAADGHTPISGLEPLSPRHELDVHVADVGLSFAQVDSRTPTLRWAPFPGRHETPPTGVGDPDRAYVQVDPSRVADVRYDLRIWGLRGNARGALVYKRDGLSGTTHLVEEPLAPDTGYLWSVRARYRVDGEERVADWSLAMLPWDHGASPRVVARETGMIPLANSFRFKTP